MQEASVIGISSFDKTTPMVDIFDEFPKITKLSAVIAKPRHAIKHQIEMFGQSVNEQSRRLHPDKLKAAQIEFQFMIDYGYCWLSNSQWARVLFTWSKRRMAVGARVAIIVGWTHKHYPIAI